MLLPTKLYDLSKKKNKERNNLLFYWDLVPAGETLESFIETTHLAKPGGRFRLYKMANFRILARNVFREVASCLRWSLWEAKLFEKIERVHVIIMRSKLISSKVPEAIYFSSYFPFLNCGHARLTTFLSNNWVIKIYNHPRDIVISAGSPATCKTCYT